MKTLIENYIKMENKGIYETLLKHSTSYKNKIYKLNWEDIEEDIYIIFSNWNGDDPYGWIQLDCSEKVFSKLVEKICSAYKEETIEIEILKYELEKISGVRTTYIGNKIVALRKFKQKSHRGYEYMSKYYEHNDEVNELTLIRTRSKSYKDNEIKTIVKNYKYDMALKKEVIIDKKVEIDNGNYEFRVPQMLLTSDVNDFEIIEGESARSWRYIMQIKEWFMTTFIILHYEWWACYDNVYNDAPLVVKEYFKSHCEGMAPFDDYRTPLRKEEYSKN